MSLPLDSTLGHLLRRSQQRHTAMWTNQFNGDLTGPQYAVLCVVYSSADLDQRAIGEMASLDKSTTADVVARLERRGWLHRSPAPEDARRNIVRLSSPARVALRGITDTARQVQGDLLDSLPATQRQRFIELLGRVAYAGDVPTAERSDGQPVEPVLPLPTAPGHLLRRAEQLHGSAWSRLVGADITPSQYAVLTALSGKPQASQVEVSELASLDKSSGADIIGRLASRGHIVLNRDPEDRRRKVLELAPQGTALLRDVTPTVQSVQDSLTQPLMRPRDKTDLIRHLKGVAYGTT